MPDLLSKLRLCTINNKRQGFPGAPVYQVFAVLFQNNLIQKDFFSSHRSTNSKKSPNSTRSNIKSFLKNNYIPLALQPTAKEITTTSHTDHINSKHDFE